MSPSVSYWAVFTLVATLVSTVTALDADKTRLAGIYVKDGNENGQLRFLASGLNTNNGNGINGINGVNGNNGLNAALNSYITNKQDMLEQLRPVNTNTGTGLITGLGTTGTATGASNAIIVNLSGIGAGTGSVTTTGTGTGTTGTTGTGSTNAQIALNQAIYGSTPVNNLLPQIIGQAVAQRQRPAGNIRRGVVQRRRVVNNNGQRRRRKGNKGKNGKKRPQVVVVRPNRG